MFAGELRRGERLLGEPDAHGVVVRPPAAAAEHEVAVAVPGRADDGRPALRVDAEEAVRLRGRADRVDRDLEPAVGPVLEAHRRRQPARHLAVGLRLGGAGADRVPADQVAEVLRRERVERLRAGRQAERRELREQPSRADDALVDAKRVVHVRVVDEALPAGDRARLLEVDPHHDEQRVAHTLGEPHQSSGVFERRGRIVDRARADHHDEARIPAVQDRPDGRAPACDRLRRRRRERHLGLDRLRRRHVLHAGDVDVVELFGVHVHVIHGNGNYALQRCRIDGLSGDRHDRSLSPRSRCLLDAAHPEPRVQAVAAARRRREGHVLHDRRRQAGARRSRHPVVRQCGALPAEDRGSDRSAGRGARLRFVVLARPSARVRGRAPPRRARAGGHRARVLHQFGLGSGRDGAQDRARVPPPAGRGDAHPVRRPRTRVPRRELRRDLGGRGPGVSQSVRRRPAAGRRSSPAHPGPGDARVRARRGGGGRRPRRRAREPDHPAARRVEYRRGDRRAGGRRGRRARPPARIPQAAPRDLRPARHPPHLRRGDHRVRAARQAVREPVSSA